MNYPFFIRVVITLFIMLLFKPTEMIAQQGEESEFQKLNTLQERDGIQLEIEFHKGLEHYYPLFAIWIEDSAGNYIESVYVAESIAKGVFEHGKVEKNKWVKGEKRIPSALPYWGHKHGKRKGDSLILPSKENPMPDAYTGATPTQSFVLHTTIDNEKVGDVFRVLFEINQSWDWNEYWYNSRYPDNQEYLKSAQPALVYEATISLNEEENTYTMKPLGHSHPYGANGELFKDLSTLTTAMQIAEKILVRVKP